MSQPLLFAEIKNESEKLPPETPSSGPIFESGPGWGFYVKRWLKKYFLRVIVPTLVIIITLGVLTAKRGAEDGEKPAATDKIKIEVTRGDSRTLLARRALAEYLGAHPEELTKGQKIFIEDLLRRKLSTQKLTIGDIFEFSTADIETAIVQAKGLTQFQLNAWEEHAKRVRF